MTAAAAGVHQADEAAPGYFDHVRPELLKLVPESARTVVDVGCGRGALGAAIRKRQGAHVTGLEFVPEAAAVAGERLDHVLCADLDALTELPVAPGSVDAAIFGDVLEHLRDPLRLLRLFREAMAPGGLVVCSIPNLKHWSVLVPLLVEDRFTYEAAGLLDRTHVHFFTLNEAEAMLAEAGFEPVALGTVLHPMPPEHRPLAEVVAHWGGDVDETAARLAVYQYLIVAR